MELNGVKVVDELLVLDDDDDNDNEDADNNEDAPKNNRNMRDALDN